MPATRSTRASHQRDADEDLKRPAAENEVRPAGDLESEGPLVLPNLTGAPVEPEAWLTMQQTFGNRAVGGLVERRKAGQSLPPKTRHDMETSFGRDFGQVQVHTGPEVDQAASSGE